jgi:hypothetical protein
MGNKLSNSILFQLSQKIINAYIKDGSDFRTGLWNTWFKNENASQKRLIGRTIPSTVDKHDLW